MKPGPFRGARLKSSTHDTEIGTLRILVIFSGVGLLLSLFLASLGWH